MNTDTGNYIRMDLMQMKEVLQRVDARTAAIEARVNLLHSKSEDFEGRLRVQEGFRGRVKGVTTAMAVIAAGISATWAAIVGYIDLTINI